MPVVVCGVVATGGSVGALGYVAAGVLRKSEAAMVQVRAETRGDSTSGQGRRK